MGTLRDLVGLLSAGHRALLGLAPVGQRFVGVFFLLMALGVNVVFALTAPAAYVDFGSHASLGLYRWGITKVVALNPPLCALGVAAFQVLIGLSLLGVGFPPRWGLIAGIAFLLLITPLGVEDPRQSRAGPGPAGAAPSRG